MAEETKVMKMIAGAKSANSPHPAIRWPLVAAGLVIIGIAIWADMIYPTLNPDASAGWSWGRTAIYLLVGLILIIGADAVMALIGALAALRKGS